MATYSFRLNGRPVSVDSWDPVQHQARWTSARASASRSRRWRPRSLASADRITVVDGDTGLCPDQGGTGGSIGLTRGGMEVRRQAAATARQALPARGATRLNRPAADLTIANGEVRPIAGGPGIGKAPQISRTSARSCSSNRR